MATTKRKPQDPQKKLLLTALKKTINTNSVIPILENILFTPGYATMTDLENTVIVPFKMDGVPQQGITMNAKMFGEIMDMMDAPSLSVSKEFLCTLTEGKKIIGLTGEDPENFPRTALMDKPYPSIGRFNSADMETLATALLFVSNDDLRPAMTGILVGKKIVSTDAHRMFYKDVSAPIKHEFIVPQKSIKILLALGGEWQLTTEIAEGKEPTHICFVREDGAKVICRTIDVPFPDYKVIIPEGKGLVKLIAPVDLLLAEIKNAGKFANKSTNQVTFGMNGVFTISSQEVDFGMEYKNQYDNKKEITFSFDKKYPKQYTLDGVKVEVLKDHGEKIEIAGEYSYSNPITVLKTDLVEIQPELHIAFNAKFLNEIISRTPAGQDVEFQMWTPSKCAIINDNFLLMPLLIKQ